MIEPEKTIHPGDRYTDEVDGFRVAVSVHYDESPDVSWLGELRDEPGPHVIDHHATGTWLSRSFRGERYFHPANPDCAQLDYERLIGYYTGEWNMIGLRVRAYREGVELGEASLWGIESDSGTDYFQSLLYDELIPEAIDEAKAALGRLCRCGGQA